jgi:hypothetical protein
MAMNQLQLKILFLSIGEQTSQEMARKNFAQYSHSRNEE